MKRLLLVLGILFFSASAYAVTYPEPTGFVTDRAGLLPAPVRDALAEKLTLYRKTTTIEIAVLIIPTLEGMTPHDYADGLWKKWHIGVVKEDNGVLLLVVPPPEKQAWIQTGLRHSGLAHRRPVQAHRRRRDEAAQLAGEAPRGCRGRRRRDHLEVGRLDVGRTSQIEAARGRQQFGRLDRTSCSRRLCPTHHLPTLD